MLPLDRLDFHCNICSAACRVEPHELLREGSSCWGCGSSVRQRGIVHSLSMELFGESLMLADFPVRKDIVGLGLSDWEGYSERLTEKFTYTNTFYVQLPRLDITAIDPALEGSADFLISGDVFEHIPPPVSLAFENSRRLLKDNGVLLLTVPYFRSLPEPTL